MNFKLLNIKNWLIFGSFITTLLNISYTYASDTEYSTEYDTDNETNYSRNDNRNVSTQKPSQVIMSSSVSYSSVNGISQESSQQYNYQEHINDNNEKEVKEFSATTNATDINGNKFKSELNSNRKLKYGSDDKLLYDYTSNNTHLEDNKNKQSSNNRSTYNKNGDSSINRQLYENGKLTDDFHKNYKNNDSGRKSYKDDNDSITKKEKESYNKFVNRYFKDTADNIASDNNNNKPKDYETQLNNIEKDMKKQFNNTFGYDKELKPNNNQCYGKDCYDINKKKNYNNKINEPSKLYKIDDKLSKLYKEEFDSKAINNTNKLPDSNINKKSYEEDNTDFLSYKNISSNKLEKKKNINQLDESSNSYNKLSIIDKDININKVEENKKIENKNIFWDMNKEMNSNLETKDNISKSTDKPKIDKVKVNNDSEKKNDIIKTDIEKNINQQGISKNLEDLLEVPDNNLAKSLNKTSDKTIDKENNQSDLNIKKSYSPEINTKLSLENESKSKLKRSDSVQNNKKLEMDEK